MLLSCSLSKTPYMSYLWALGPPLVVNRNHYPQYPRYDREKIPNPLFLILAQLCNKALGLKLAMLTQQTSKVNQNFGNFIF